MGNIANIEFGFGVSASIAAFCWAFGMVFRILGGAAGGSHD